MTSDIWETKFGRHCGGSCKKFEVKEKRMLGCAVGELGFGLQGCRNGTFRSMIIIISVSYKSCQEGGGVLHWDQRDIYDGGFRAAFWACITTTRATNVRE
jgi:hypothetical protein